MGTKFKKETPPMEREIDYLLGDLCVKWGFCLPPNKWDQICKKSYWSAMEFASEVVSAEGMNPEYENKWVRKISNKFRERFGCEKISQNSFIDRIRDIKEKW